MAKKEPILIITIKDGVVNEAKLFTNLKRAEEAFIIKAMDLGARKDDIDSHLDDGYYPGSNETVCIVHPEVL
jgi:hypothetical protein